MKITQKNCYIHDFANPSIPKDEEEHWIRVAALADFFFYDDPEARVHLPAVWIDGNIFSGYLRSKKAFVKMLSSRLRGCQKD